MKIYVWLWRVQLFVRILLEGRDILIGHLAGTVDRANVTALSNSRLSRFSRGWQSSYYFDTFSLCMLAIWTPPRRNSGITLSPIFEELRGCPFHLASILARAR
jgi:hypothetical protein